MYIICVIVNIHTTLERAIGLFQIFGSYRTSQKASVDSVLILSKCKIIRIFFPTQRAA